MSSAHRADCVRSSRDYLSKGLLREGAGRIQSNRKISRNESAAKLTNSRHGLLCCVALAMIAIGLPGRAVGRGI
jgi:hypothetical protein